MTDLGTLTLATFSGRVGDAFDLLAGDGRLGLTLEEAEPVGAGTERTAFSLVFTGPARPAVDQGIHRLEHAELGALDLFLVPIAPGSYQAIFT